MDSVLVITLFSVINLIIFAFLLLKLNQVPKHVEKPIQKSFVDLEQKLNQTSFDNYTKLQAQLNENNQRIYDSNLKSQNLQSETIQKLIHSIETQLRSNTQILQKSLSDNYANQHKQLHEVLAHSTKQLQEQFNKLNQATERHLVGISQNVESQLIKGFEKTNETFTNIIKRLAIIDDAQKKITDLSQNVVSLQEILHDKRSRGAFGEVQLKALIQNLLPEKCYQLQFTLSTGQRADCALFLPQPTGTIMIDAKFPLENYRKLTDLSSGPENRSEISRQFKQDIKKHIQDISEKYIVPNETADGALMFIPAEAIFAEIHAHHPDLIELSHQKKVWMASPTTLMAILTTAQSVVKDHATREQIHIIQKHLKLLAKDFTRFEKRMDNLTKHLQQANLDAEQVHTSAKKISKRFTIIENVELTDENEPESLLEQKYDALPES